MRKLWTALAVFIASLACPPGAALGHATLEGSSPPRDAVVERQPEAVTFRFSEPVEGNFGAVRVYDADGARVEGEAFHPGAGAHVTLQPSEAAAGGYTVLDVRVPNETDGAATTKVDVQFPPGFAFASYQPVDGWSAQVRMEKLAEPLSHHGEEVTEGVARITWTADGGGDGIQPGQFQDFPVSVQIPDEAGETLTFKALQTYDEVVRWIGGPEAEKPAAQVSIAAAVEDHGSSDDSAARDDSDGAGEGLGIAALILGALGLLTGGAALLRTRRTG